MEIQTDKLNYQNWNDENLWIYQHFFFIVLDGISESWQAFDTSRFKTYFKISSLSTHLNRNWGFFLHTSPMVGMLGWFLYLTIAFKRGSWMLSVNELQLF